MSSVRAIREALRAQLDTVDGLTAYDVWPDTISPPAAIVRPLSGAYHATMGGPSVAASTYEFEVTLLLQLGWSLAAQEDLDAYIANDSALVTALEADPRLGGLTDAVVVRGWRDYGVLNVGLDAEGNPAEFLGVRFDVGVFA